MLKPNFDISAYNNQIGQFKWIKNVDYNFTETNNIVYCNTDKLPASGTILIGREQMTYTSKLSDRLLGVSWHQWHSYRVPCGWRVTSDYSPK